MFQRASNANWRGRWETDRSSLSWLSRSRLDPWSWQSRNLWSFLSVCLSPPSDKHDSQVGPSLHNFPLTDYSAGKRYLSFEERWVSAEGSGQYVVIDFIPKITTEDAEIVWNIREEHAWSLPALQGPTQTFAKFLTKCKELFTSFPIQQTGVLPTDPGCSANTLLHFLDLPFLFVLCGNLWGLEHRPTENLWEEKISKLFLCIFVTILLLLTPCGALMNNHVLKFTRS